MAKPSDKIREWSQRLSRFNKSGASLIQFCQDEKVSIPSFYYWRNRIRSIGVGTPADLPEVIETSSPSIMRFTIHAGVIKIECQAESTHALDAVLSWAARSQDSKFQQLIVQS